MWGATRDGKQFMAALSVAARARIVALADIDPHKLGGVYTNHRVAPSLTLPLVHTRDIVGPAVVCVTWRRPAEAPRELAREAAPGCSRPEAQAGPGEAAAGGPGGAGAAAGAGGPGATCEIRKAAAALGMVEGETVWFFS